MMEDGVTANEIPPVVGEMTLAVISAVAIATMLKMTERAFEET